MFLSLLQLQENKSSFYKIMFWVYFEYIWVMWQAGTVKKWKSKQLFGF